MRMIKTFTKNDLLRFLYDELPVEERNEVRNMQLTDELVEHETDEMESVKKLLDKFILKAPADAVENVLKYSRSI